MTKVGNSEDNAKRINNATRSVNFRNEDKPDGLPEGHNSD
jgi:hypothetical protein